MDREKEIRLIIGEGGRREERIKLLEIFVAVEVMEAVIEQMKKSLKELQKT